MKKIGFEDIFDVKSIEKTFEQTLEVDILKIIDNWNKEKKEELNNSFRKSEEEIMIEKICRRVLQEEIMAMINGKGLFGERFNKNLQLQGFVKDCPTCCYNASNDYACGRKNE